MGATEFTSTGRPGEPENRSYRRLYQTWDKPINDIQKLIDKFNFLESNVDGHRRIVLKSLCSNQVLNEAIQTGLPIEAVIPMSIVTGDESSIIFLGKNFHDSPPQGRKEELNLIVEKKPLEKITSVIEKGFTLSNHLNENDSDNLYSLWHRFGWTREGIVDFIKKIQSHENNLWFSGMRDNLTGQLVSASQAEAVNFSGIRYVETTEYSTLEGYSKHGLCTASVEGLVAQVLNDTNKENVPTVITAEFNTSSTSSAVGANAGFIIPKHDGISQILSYNVAVEDNEQPNQISFEPWEDPDGIPLKYLRDFAVAVLPAENIQRFYSPDVVQEIINLYQ